MNISENRLSTIYYPKKINNLHGRYWSWIHVIILAHLGVMKPRAGSYTDPWNSKLDPIMQLPDLKYVDYKLSDLLDERALELFSKAKESNRRIYVMWSGGIDSTAVLTSFLKNLSPQDQQLITVVLSAASIDENPQYYVNYIDNKLDVVQFTNLKLTEDFLKNKGIVITGDPGDCLFGPSTLMYESLVPQGKHNSKFKDNLDLIAHSIEYPRINIIKKHKMDGFGKWYVDKVTNNLLEVNIPDVETIADWWWWHYINLKWEASIWRPLIRRKVDVDEKLSIPTINEFVTNTFFNTAKFQQWSYSNRRLFIINDDMSTHKHELKKYILDFNNDETYYNTKTKVQSLPPGVRDYPIFVNWDWSGYKANPETEQQMIASLEEYKG